MTSNTSFYPSMGGYGHLKLYAPHSVCPYQVAARRQFAPWEPLNLAFQHATGWELSIGESAASLQNRKRQGDKDLPAIPELGIVDLSQLLPPGIPAVSRIHCEKLIEEFNHVLQVLAQSRSQLVPRIAESQGPAIGPIVVQEPRPIGRRVSEHRKLPLLRSNLPLFTSNLALNPLVVSEKRATCEWYLDDSGIARFTALACPGQEPDSTGELIAARATFLAECRHVASNRNMQQAIQSSVSRLFPSETRLDVITGTLNLLTGDIMLWGLEKFQALSSFPFGTRYPEDANGTEFHLPRGQHLLLCHWPDTCDTAGVESWSRQTSQRLRGLSLADLPRVFMEQVSEVQSTLRVKPSVALCISRPS